MKKFLLILVVLILHSCDSKSHSLGGRYELYWIDEPSAVKVGIRTDNGAIMQRVSASVTAFGSNEKWVTVSRIDPKSKITEYFYWEKHKDDQFKNSEDIVEGPFSYEEFKALNVVGDLPPLEKVTMSD